MRGFKSCLILGAILLCCLIDIRLGSWTHNPWAAAAGGIGICYVILRVISFGKTSRKKRAKERIARNWPPAVAPRRPVDANDTDGLVEQMLEQGRFALLLRPQIVANLAPAQFGKAVSALEKAMALVPDGDVVLDPTTAGPDDGSPADDEPASSEISSARGRVIQVERFLLDRYPVSNREFHGFVAAGGYQEMALWEESIWPAVLDLVDATGSPGPRYWQNGYFPPGRENHPVVGVNWFEACAYARWLGKRLPSDAEWVKAGSWPVHLSSDARMQRRYPWGGTMDRSRANLWGSGANGIVPVDQFAKGVSVGGVYQLIGNVWEWTSGNFRAVNLDPDDRHADEIMPAVPMKNIRGGAFDTYFDNQATCQFRSGENPLHRRHNVGFRCAVGIRDLVLARTDPAEVEQVTDTQTVDRRVPEAEEVPA